MHIGAHAQVVGHRRRSSGTGTGCRAQAQVFRHMTWSTEPGFGTQNLALKLRALGLEVFRAVRRTQDAVRKMPSATAAKLGDRAAGAHPRPAGATPLSGIPLCGAAQPCEYMVYVPPPYPRTCVRPWQQQSDQRGLERRVCGVLLPLLAQRHQAGQQLSSASRVDAADGRHREQHVAGGLQACQAGLRELGRRRLALCKSHRAHLRGCVLSCSVWS